MGTRWSLREPGEVSGSFQYSQEWEKEDTIYEVSDLQRNSELVKQMLCSIDQDLNFSMEIAPDFKDGRIPTLDFSLWFVKEPRMTMPVDRKLTRGEGGQKTSRCPWRLTYTFFSKPVVTQYTELESSGRSWHSKAAGQSQEVVGPRGSHMKFTVSHADRWG